MFVCSLFRTDFDDLFEKTQMKWSENLDTNRPQLVEGKDCQTLSTIILSFM